MGKRLKHWPLAAAFISLLAMAKAPENLGAKGPPPFAQLGPHGHHITTSLPLAQRYFNQGLNWVYAFNHHEAIRSFQEAARLDPQCAMCFWGIALAYGPNINREMPAEDLPLAKDAMARAIARKHLVTARERHYIDVLAVRYAGADATQRGAEDLAYANAMRRLMRSYPDDMDAATLFAEALMDTMPWNYWQANGEPKPATREVMAALESVLKRDEWHIGANHYYIHAVEASPHPEWGWMAARRLEGLAPDAGHLVHMSSHIYLRMGLYHEASTANERAIAVDEAYLTRQGSQGFYPAFYASHNANFLWYSTAMEGRSRDSIAAARQAFAMVSAHSAHAHSPMMSMIVVAPWLALVRFGHWQEMLAQSAPTHLKHDLYLTAMWHYSRGIASLRLGHEKEAAREAAALDAIAENPSLQALEHPQLPGATIVRLARYLLMAEGLAVQGDHVAMRQAYDAAIRLEDSLPYMEPPFWYHPTRQFLGAALLEKGDAAGAATIYREDLQRHPNNGWSLLGLAKSLGAQGLHEEAARVDKAFHKAWQYADITLNASRF